MIPTSTAPSGEAAEDRVRHEQHPGQRDHERRAAEEDRAARRSPGRLDRIELLHPACPLLAEAGDDEERVVDPEREAHAREHVDDEERDLPHLTDDRNERQREDDRDDRQQHRHERGDDGAEDDQQHEQRRREAEEELAFLQILVRKREQVVVGRELAGDRHLVRASSARSTTAITSLIPSSASRPIPIVSTVASRSRETRLASFELYVVVTL